MMCAGHVAQTRLFPFCPDQEELALATSLWLAALTLVCTHSAPILNPLMGPRTWFGFATSCLLSLSSSLVPVQGSSPSELVLVCMRYPVFPGI